MTATAQAMERIRDGMPRGLAIFKTANEYGIAVSKLARQLSGKRKRTETRTVDAWWNR